MEAVKISDTVYTIDGMTVAIVAGSDEGMSAEEIDSMLRGIIQSAMQPSQE